MTDKMQGGAMGGVEDLYREVILDHFKSPKNRGTIETPNAKAEGMNPLCGDQLTMTGVVEGDVLKDVKFEGHGCAVSQSAASMLTAVMKGKKIDEIRALASVYKGMFGVEDESKHGPGKFVQDDLGDLISLEGVKKYPVRIKCALLSANTLLELLSRHPGT